MSSEYDRSASPSDGTACGYTDYERSHRAETESVDGDVPATGVDANGIERRVWNALYGVEDPEMPISIVDLGLVYGVDVAAGTAEVAMTLTYTGCPAREMLLDEVEAAVAAVDGIDDAAVTLVWTPGWSVDMVTDRGREELAEFGLSIE